MELKQPGDLQLAIDTPATLHRELGQLINPTTTTSQQAGDAWLSWWATADQRLRTAFADDDLVLPLYQSTAVIKSAAPPGSWRATPADSAHELAIVLRERDIWVERLESAEARLHLIQGFMARPGRGGSP